MLFFKQMFWTALFIAGFTLGGMGTFCLAILPLTFVVGDWAAAGNGNRADLALEFLGMMFLGEKLAKLGWRKAEEAEDARGKAANEQFVLVCDVQIGDEVTTALTSGFVMDITPMGQGSFEDRTVLLEVATWRGRDFICRGALDLIKRVEK